MSQETLCLVARAGFYPASFEPLTSAENPAAGNTITTGNHEWRHLIYFFLNSSLLFHYPFTNNIHSFPALTLQLFPVYGSPNSGEKKASQKQNKPQSASLLLVTNCRFAASLTLYHVPDSFPHLRTLLSPFHVEREYSTLSASLIITVCQGTEVHPKLLPSAQGSLPQFSAPQTQGEKTDLLWSVCFNSIPHYHREADPGQIEKFPVKTKELVQKH